MLPHMQENRGACTTMRIQQSLVVEKVLLFYYLTQEMTAFFLKLSIT